MGEWFFIAPAEMVIEKKGRGPGHWGHKGRPGKRGGSIPNITAESFHSAQTRKEINLLKRKALRAIDEADDRALAQRPSSYAERAHLRSSFLPEGHPQSEGELEDLVKEARERMAAQEWKPTSAAEARERRISTTVTSEGRRRARRMG